MSKRLVIFLVVLAATALGAFALGWFYGPGPGFWPMPISSPGYWMHPGMGFGMHHGFGPGGWMNSGWGGMWLFGAGRLLFWIITIGLLAGLVAWLVKPGTPQNKGQ